MNYPQSYHTALAWLINNGAYNGRREQGRKLVAAALRGARDQSREQELIAHRELLFIAGRMPVKARRKRVYPKRMKAA